MKIIKSTLMLTLLVSGSCYAIKVGYNNIATPINYDNITIGSPSNAPILRPEIQEVKSTMEVGENAKLTLNQIGHHAVTRAAAQANQAKNNILSLLRD